jgi:hypothetical protein
MWNIKCFFTPVITGVIELVIKGIKLSVDSARRASNRASPKKKKNSCTRDIAHNEETATMWNLKPEWWGARAEGTKEKEPCDKI